MEGNARKHDELRSRVEAIDVGGRVRFRVAQSLRVGQHDVHRLAGRRHPTEDVVARAVENAGHTGERVTGKPFSHAVNQRHAATNRRLEAEPHAGARRGSQQLRAVGREQHLVGGHHRCAPLDRLADPFARGRDTTDDFDHDIGRTGEHFVEVVGPDDGRGNPIGTLARHAAIEHVRQPESIRQFRTLDENPRDRGADGAETEERDFERALGSGLSALGSWFRLSALGFWA